MQPMPERVSISRDVQPTLDAPGEARTFARLPQRGSTASRMNFCWPARSQTDRRSNARKALFIVRTIRAIGVSAVIVTRVLTPDWLWADDPTIFDSGRFQSAGWLETAPEVERLLPAPAPWASAGNSEPLASGEPWSWTLLPNGLMYTSYAAGEREPRLSTAFLQESGGEVLWDSALGGRVGIVRYGNTSSMRPEGWQLDVEGAAFVRLLPENERDVQAVDFRAGIPLTYRRDNFQWKFGYYHISSHLGDEFLLKHPGYDRLNYSRDALVCGIGYFPVDAIRLYFELGAAVIYTSGGAEPWELQTGIEYDTHRVTGIRGEPYFAANLHLFEETDWGGNLNILAGWQWRGRQSSHVFRAGLQYFNGQNSQKSFLGDSHQLLGGGIRYDF
jgi:hypothetical protein